MFLALQTTEAVVPGSSPASLTKENSEYRRRDTVYAVQYQGREGNLPPEVGGGGISLSMLHLFF